MRPAVEGLLFGAALAVAGCGGEGAPEGEPRWSVARVAGVAHASGVAIDGDALLLVTGGGGRSLYVVRRQDLRAGGTAPAREVPLTVRGEARLGGVDPMAGRGFEVSDLWAEAVDLQGIAVHAPDVLCVLDRRYRVVYAGLLSRDAQGLAVAARLDRAFVVPGADRPGSGRADWRDASGGLVGLTAAVRGRSQDLLAVDARGAEVWSMDRFGQMPQRLRVALPPGAEADVGDLASVGDGVLLVRGPAPGSLVRLDPVGSKLAATVGLEEEAPRAEGAGPWGGIALAADGTLHLVSSGDACFVAWRAPRRGGVPPPPPRPPAPPQRPWPLR